MMIEKQKTLSHKRQKSYCEYQKTIRAGAWKKFVSRFGIPDLIISLGVSVFVAIWTKSLYIVLLTGGVFFYIYCVVYLFHFAKEHVYLYNKQAERIEQFWPEDLDLRIYDSSRSDVFNENGDKFPALLLSVVNGEMKKKIVELEGQIASIFQTSIEPDTGEAMTLPFFAEQRIVWDDGTTTSELRPGDNLDFYLGYLDDRDPPILRFGEGGFTNWLFEREAVYQFSIQFMGKLEGETEFRRFHYMQVLYAHPSSGLLSIGHRAIDIHYDIPKEFVKVINVAEEGYWHDFSSPYRRQQEEKNKKD